MLREKVGKSWLPRDGLHVVEVGSGDLRGDSRNPGVRTSP